MQKTSQHNKERVIAHIDMDCFYVQVERVRNKSLMNKPVVVVQYNPFGDLKPLHASENRIVNTNGGIIAVSYEARAHGVKRSMRGLEAKKICPDLVQVQVPTAYGKADISVYREAGDSVVHLLNQICCCPIEKASIDEVYLDITSVVQTRLQEAAGDDTGRIYQQILSSCSKSKIAGQDENEIKLSKHTIRCGHMGTNMNNYNQSDGINEIELLDFESIGFGSSRNFSSWSIHDKYLVCGAAIVYEIRQQILQQLGFTCSSGIAHNRMLAKMASSMHKPNKQTLVPRAIVPSLMLKLPISRVPGFGGKLGEEILNLPGNIETFGDILKIDKNVLIQRFGDEITTRLLDTAVGIDDEPVKDRSLNLSLASGKNFPSSNALTIQNIKDGVVLKWLVELSKQLNDRITLDKERNSRQPKTITIHALLTVFPCMPIAEEITKTSESMPSPSHLVTTITSSPSNDSNNRRLEQNESCFSVSLSKVFSMRHSISDTISWMSTTALQTLMKAITESKRVPYNSTWVISSMSLTATNFEFFGKAAAHGSKRIQSYFHANDRKTDQGQNDYELNDNDHTKDINHVVEKEWANESNERRNTMTEQAKDQTKDEDITGDAVHCIMSIRDSDVMVQDDQSNVSYDLRTPWNEAIDQEVFHALPKELQLEIITDMKFRNQIFPLKNNRKNDAQKDENSSLLSFFQKQEHSNHSQSTHKIITKNTSPLKSSNDNKRPSNLSYNRDVIPPTNFPSPEKRKRDISLSDQLLQKVKKANGISKFFQKA